MVFVALFTLTVVLLTIVIKLWDRKQKLFFQDRNIPFIKSSIFGGSFKDVLTLKKSVVQVMSESYKEAEKLGAPCIGIRILHKNVLIIRDLEVIKQVLVKDFNHFSNRSVSSNAHHDPFGAYNLFFVKNPIWHDMRSKITPTFTTSRMRNFFDNVNEIGGKFARMLLKDVPEQKIISLKEFSGCFTTEVYASCAFGIEINFIEDPSDKFGTMAMDMFKFNTWRALEFGAGFVAPEIANHVPMYVFSKHGSKMLKEMLHEVMVERLAKGINRYDIMDVVVKIKQAQEHCPDESITKFNDDMLLAQCVIFFAAGFETTSTALTHAIYELAKNPHVQAKLKEEINCALKSHSELTYDHLSELKYLQMFCYEVFRLYPSFSFLNRSCTPDNGQAFYSLKPNLDFDLPQGFPIYIPIYALHRDKQYFEDPETFDPERFSQENISKIPKGAFLPFGMGPRNCIAERLGYMVMKMGILNTLRNHSVEFCEQTPKVIRPHNLVMLNVPDKNIYVRLRRDDKDK